jgi:hypothetical protein
MSTLNMETAHYSKMTETSCSTEGHCDIQGDQNKMGPIFTLGNFKIESKPLRDFVLLSLVTL